jgi:hypothetical protein
MSNINNELINNPIKIITNPKEDDKIKLENLSKTIVQEGVFKDLTDKIIFKKINIYSEIQDEDFEIIELQNLIKKLTGVPSVLFFNSNKELLDIKVVGNDISRFKEILNKNFLNN